MAGAGYKLFNTGDVLTAAQVNTYLQEQAVMRFANAAARTTALSGVLAEGMMSYLMDTDVVEVYNGTAWVGITGDGDITGVTAGTGISGGGTSGTVTITNAMATEITASGDIIVGTGSGTFDNLPIGTTGQVLTADTTVSPYKVKWASAASPTYSWTDYTPDFKQSTTTITKTVDWARYVVINKLVIVSVNLQATSTGVSSGRIYISWPSGYTPKYVQSNGLYPMYGVGHWYDASQNINHMAHITEDNGTFALKATQSDVNNYLAATVNTSAIASGDRVGFTVMYEVA